MSYEPIISKILFASVLSSVVLYRYGDWHRHRIIVTGVVLLAWTFSFLVIFALPLDVISTTYRQCLEDNPNSTLITSNTTSPCQPPRGNVSDTFFPTLWRTVYWSMQCLTWLWMPMMQSYIKAGDFTIKGKLKSALIDNAIYYGSYLFICGILLIYLATKPGVELDWPKLKAIASSASNTWGLFLLVLLLGYALVEVPRSLWHNSNYSYVLNHAYFKAAKLSSDKAEAEETVDDVLESLHGISLLIRPGHYLHDHLETILSRVPTELRGKMGRRRVGVHTDADQASGDCPSEKTLVRLHRQVIKSLQVLQRTETQWNLLVVRIFDLEDTLRNLNSRDRQFKRTFEPARSALGQFLYNAKIEWYWKCALSNYTRKGLAILAAVVSVAIVWSEVTFFNKQPVLSIFANIVNVAKARYDYITIELLSTLIILYLCYCAYSTVLKIRVLNLYYLAPHHQTNEYSLIFSGMMLSRLTPAICLNFLGLIHMDSHIIKKSVLETHYTQIMGHMDVIAIISDGFNVYFPMAILAFCFATYFSLGARALSMIGFHQFVGDDEITTDLVNDGRELIKREKRRRQRAEESHNRRRDFQERFSSNADNGAGRKPFSASGVTSTTRVAVDTNLLHDPARRYEGTRISTPSHGDARMSSETRFAPADSFLDDDDDIEDLDLRFGVSTRPTVTMSTGTYGGAKRGIFDDV